MRLRGPSRPGGGPVLRSSTLKRSEGGACHAVAQRPEKSEGGFTLIELIAVILIIALIAGFAASNVDVLVPKYRLRAAAREVASSLKEARARAAATGKDVYFEIDLPKGRYWILVAQPRQGEPGEGPLLTRDLEYQPAFERSLPDQVEFVDVLVCDKDKVAEGRARVRLSPFGTSAHLIVNLRLKEGRVMAVKLNGFTGSVTFHDSYKEGEALLEDSGN